MRRHALDPFSLVVGLAFVGIGLVFLLGDDNLVVRLRWAWPILLVSLGLGVILKLALPGERREAATTAGLPDTATAEPWRATDPYLAPAAASDHEPEPLPDAGAAFDHEPEPPPDAGTAPEHRTQVPREGRPPDEAGPGPEPRAGGDGGSR